MLINSVVIKNGLTFIITMRRPVGQSTGTHLNPLHLTKDLAERLSGLDNVPRLSSNVYATNDLEYVVENNDFIILAVTMNRLTELLNYLKPLIDKKAGYTCLISPIKGLVSDEIHKELVTPSQMINYSFANIRHKYEIVCIGGPFLILIWPWVIPFVLPWPVKRK